ncbi:hypothetical protein H8M03_06265 [Sphingomonas sabuli]|uniref:Uncharacterized protein n=1 Tax=Sphingomonas sabuli TaxID=2764186 RepID=A0A7G9L5L0_9SPHN|nr:hypothetical protein [Sphingomonas sabuli]QNM83909.1 hypothetical protein H8M03_06265 [Sphingomonas sabuli]
MIEKSKSKKTSVPLKPPAAAPGSRIRRDPILTAEAEREARYAWWRSEEMEVPLAVAGIVAFALAINIVILAVGAYWN